MVEDTKAAETEETTGLDKEFMDDIKKAIDLTEENEHSGEKEKNNSSEENSENENNLQEETEGEEGGEEKSGDDEVSIDRDLVERAVRVGMKLEDAQAMPNDETLQRIVEGFEKSAKTVAELKEGGASGSESGSKEDDDFLSKIPELDSDAWDQDTVDMVNNLKKVLGEEIKSLQNKIGEQNGIIEGLQKNILTSEQRYVDQKIADLGDQYKDLFGKGSTADLPEGKQRDARSLLARYIEFIGKTEGEKLSRDDVFDRAFKSAFSDEIKSIEGEKKKTVDASKKRAEHVVSQPRNIHGKFASEKSTDGLGSEDERENAAVKDVEALMEQTD